MNGTMMQARPNDRYVMGRTSAEYERLRRQAKALEPSTAALLDRIGLTAGMHCLDVGCGPGEVMRLMGQRVGAAGRVVGIDLDARLGNEAAGILRAAGESQFDFVGGDIREIESIPGAPFDLVYARLVLIHSPNPQALLRAMYRWVKPGGCLVVQDYDFRTLDAYPRSEPIEAFRRVFQGVFERAGLDTQIGHKLPWHFVEAGLGTPDGGDVSGILASMEQSWEMAAAVYQSLLPLALKLGLTTAAESERFFRQIEEAAEQRYHAVLWPLLLGAWKRKPS
jgi:ubiquinone/menaquinone biosynthesis C-methylase UbiE